MQWFFQIVGALLIVGGCVAVWSILKGNKVTAGKATGAVAFGLLCILGGGLLVLQERVTKLTVSKLGSIEASAAQARADASAIAELKTRVEAQSATVDLVAKDAAAARKTMAGVEKRSEEASTRLDKLDDSIRVQTKNLEEAHKDAAALRVDISKRQAALAEDQKAIREQTQLLGYSVAAKAGDASAWEALTTASGAVNPSPVSVMLTQDVLRFYEVERHNLVQRHVADQLHRVKHVSLEEACEMLAGAEAGGVEAAANELAELKRESAVSVLIKRLSSERNLRVISRITAALEVITGTSFLPLGKQEALMWWEANKDKQQYIFPDEIYASMQKNPLVFANLPTSDPLGYFSITFTSASAEQTIALANELLKREEFASATRHTLLIAQLSQGRVADGRATLTALETKQSNFWRLSEARALVQCAEGNLDDAAKNLNSFLSDYPQLGGYLHLLALLKPLEKRTDVNWPSPERVQLIQR